MTQIDFYTHVDDKLKTACRLAGKACGRGLRVMVLCSDSETARRVDHLMWTTPPIGFVPHCAPGDPLSAVTPVLIAAGEAEPPHDEVLVNLGVGRPAYFSRFRRLIEIVSLDDGDRAGARERFRFYRDRGYEIRTHDLSGGAESA